MQYTLALLALAASACAQGVTQIITPPAPAPTGCSTSFTGNFMVNAHNVSTTSKKRGLEKRVTACGGDGTLVLTLQNGVLKDAQARTGYIADNRQFQFDGPPQTGAIYTAGFSVCANDTLALGGSTVFYQCLSGNFYNLYDQSQGGQCNQAYFEVIPCVVVGGTTITASTVSTLPSTVAVIPSPTLSPQSASHMFSTMSSTMTASSATMLMNVTVTTSTRTGTATASGSVLSTASGSVHSSTTATGTAAASPSIASSTGAASILSTGKEFAALAAGFAALVMI